jgi:hypothetical protein
MDRKFLCKNKRGLSAVVTTVILVALSLAAVAVVWMFVSNLINRQIGSSKSCYGNYDKVRINGQYTCYEYLGEENYNLRFSLSIGDVAVSVSSASTVKSYEITNTAQTVSGLSMYPLGSSSVNLPDKNAGLTYKATGFTSVIDSISIAPVIGGNLCEISDSLSDVEDCALSE